MITLLFSIPKWLRITISLFYLTCVALLSLLPPDDFPSQLPSFPGADKLVHICMYFGLASLTCWSMRAEAQHRWYYFVILFAICWGITMEIFQLIMHVGRSFEMFDILANSVGSLIGILGYMLLNQGIKNSDLKRQRQI